MMIDEPCGCCDYEPDDPDDSLCAVCVCGHTVEEHEQGFFRRCSFAGEEGAEAEEPKP